MNGALKIIGLALGALIAPLILAPIVLYASSSVALRRTYEGVGEPIAVRSHSASIARGQPLATAMGKSATINPFMPRQAAGKMTDDEIRAVWLYLRSVPPKKLAER